jgi:ABC-type multidrug transport system ATPase subunit
VHEGIRADGICRVYGLRQALSDVSLNVCPGECVGVFGFSGSGKSVLLRVLAGLEVPDSGTVTCNEGSPCLSLPVLTTDASLTPFEDLELFASLYGIPRAKRRTAIRKAIALTGLDAEQHTRTGNLSSGARKRLEIARVLMSPSDVLLFDEPMSDLDSRARRRVWGHLLKLRTSERKSIVVATSRTEDAEVCDKVLLLHEGRVLAQGDIEELRRMAGPEAMVIRPIAERNAGRSHKPALKRIVGAEEDGSFLVQMGMDSRPVDVLRRIAGDVAAVRFHARRLDTILQELIVSSQAHPDL